MCGIAGAVAFASSGMSREVVGRMLERIAHRGPDGSGIVEYAAADARRVLLGHRRLDRKSVV